MEDIDIDETLQNLNLQFLWQLDVEFLRLIIKIYSLRI